MNSTYKITSNSTLSNTGKYISIPENSFYVITAIALFNNTKPLVLALCSSPSAIANVICISNNTIDSSAVHLSVCCSGIVSSGDTLSLYIWECRDSTSTLTNDVSLSGYYYTK